MALDPDDLLIFSKRQKPGAKAKKPSQQQPAAPAPQAQPPTPQPKIIAQPIVTGLPEPVSRPEPEAQRSTQKEEPYTVPVTQVPLPRPKYGGKKAQIREMKKLASTLACELHPWRKAYAICDYCKRAFCYEDIVEESGMFYCIDDIDKIPESVKSVKIVSYGRISALAVFFFVTQLGLFVITQYTTLAQFIGSVMVAITTQTPLYEVLFDGLLFFIGLIFAILSFAAGAMIILETKISYRFALAIGAIGAGFFFYDYIVSFQILTAIYAVVELIAMVLLLYSRRYYESVPMHSEGPAAPALGTLS